MEGIPNNFACGFAYGFIVAGIFGIIVSEIRSARVRMGSRNRPLDTFPDAIQPRITPTSVVWGSIRAMFACGFWTVLFILAFIVLVYLAFGLSNFSL